MSFATLPDSILHLIRTYIAPTQPTVYDDEKYQSPPLYRPMMSYSIFAPFLNRILSAHTTLSDCCTRWDLFPQTLSMVLEQEGLDEKRLEEGLMETGDLAGHIIDEKAVATSDVPALQKVQSVDSGEVTAQEQVIHGINEEHVDLVHEEQDDEGEEEDSDWSERDYEEDSEGSDWDSEDESDYEDDWEAEYGFSLPKTEPVKQIPVLSTGMLAPGRSLLDF
jgi:hypothetical protein